MEERHRSVHDNQAMIQNIAHEAQSLRELYPRVKVARSILDAPSDSGSILGDTRSSIISDREFEFDDLVINSQAYRRALQAAKRELRKGGVQQTEGDLIDMGNDADEATLSQDLNKASLSGGENVIVSGPAEAQTLQQTLKSSDGRSRLKHNDPTPSSSTTINPKDPTKEPGQASRAIFKSWEDAHRDRERKNTNNTRLPAIAPGYQPTATEDKPKSSYPHAFERWETLSAHWEGLTSFWIRRLERNTAEFNNDPSSEQLAEQVKDLSAAGKNLFDAVVELQRLRASSERKFQRWFFETRAEQERSRELVISLEETLREERVQHQNDLSNERVRLTVEFEKSLVHERGELEARLSKLQREASEQRRTLSSTKEEARRAWYELGRREEVERNRISKMESCKPVMIGEVVLFPLKSSSWDEDSEKMIPLLYEVSQPPEVPEPWIAQWDSKPSLPAADFLMVLIVYSQTNMINGCLSTPRRKNPDILDPNRPLDRDPNTKRRAEMLHIALLRSQRERSRLL